MNVAMVVMMYNILLLVANRKMVVVQVADGIKQKNKRLSIGTLAHQPRKAVWRNDRNELFI